MLSAIILNDAICRIQYYLARPCDIFNFFFRQISHENSRLSFWIGGLFIIKVIDVRKAASLKARRLRDSVTRIFTLEYNDTGKRLRFPVYVYD